METCKLAWVSGRVQGVGFRYYTQRKARALGVAGYAKNLSDGRVEIVVRGSTPNVDALLAWLLDGPTNAVVNNIEVDSQPSDWQGIGFTTS
jgi:acylphosphatase